MENQLPVNSNANANTTGNHDNDNEPKTNTTTANKTDSIVSVDSNVSDVAGEQQVRIQQKEPVHDHDQSQSQSQSQGQKQEKQKKPERVDGEDENEDEDEDEDEDMDELDDVLDDFSKPSASAKQDPKTATTQSSQQAPPSTSATTTTANENENENDESFFMKQLERDMANMMSQAADESGVADHQGFENAVDQGAEHFAKKLESSGIPPGELLKQLVSDIMAEEGGDGAGSTTPPHAPRKGPSDTSNSTSRNTNEKNPSSSSGGDTSTPPESFNDAIHRTINRMKESGDKATEAATGNDFSDDLLAQLLKTVEAGGGTDEGDLSTVISGMMEQLSNKEMLYEPMKDLDTKFGPWLNMNKEKVPSDDLARYQLQATYVSEIVAKFEEPGYTDDDPGCRAYIWERMQSMQAAGSPPEELVSNPWSPMLDDAVANMGKPGSDAGGMPECPQQ